MQPNTPTKVAWHMPDINHTFLKGHRIMLQIQSSWFPLVDRNPQKFVDIYKATEADFQKATVQVHRSGAQASRITFSVLPQSMTPSGSHESRGGHRTMAPSRESRLATRDSPVGAIHSL